MSKRYEVGRYFETKLYKRLQCSIDCDLRDSGTLVQTMRYCLVGAKGVGKSSLLEALCKNINDTKKGTAHHLDLQFAYKRQRLEEIINDYFSVDQSGRTNLLFIDNIQHLPSTMKGVLKSNISQLDVLVCASSRAGLAQLISDKIIRLNPHDLEIWVMNPEKDVTESIFQELYTGQKDETVQQCLEMIGHIPGKAVVLARLLSRGLEDIETFTDGVKEDALRCLETDKELFEPNNTAIFFKFLTICAAGGIEKSYMLKFLHLTIADLPWTMLKMEKQTEIKTIMPVSPLCKEAIESYIANTSDTWKQVFDLMNQFSLPSGNIRGLVFEIVVGKALTKVERFTYYGCTGTTTAVTLGRIATNVSTAKSHSSVGTIHENTCLSTPRMTGCDFLLKVNKQLYFIQCTVGDVDKKLDFWKDAPVGAISLLVTPRCDSSFVTELLARRSGLSNNFRENKFQLVDAALIPSDDIKYFL